MPTRFTRRGGIYTAVLVLSLILIMGAVFFRVAYAQWSEPTAPPTGNNTNPPLDTSSTSQNKTGALTVGSTTNYTAVGMYAPIYYDANNTSYYLQPSNTSISLQAAGNICASTNCLVTSGLSIENSSSFPAFPGSTTNGDFAIGGIGPADSISFGTQNAAGNGWAERMRFGIGANTGSSYIDVYEPTTFTQLITANNGIKFSDGTIQTSASGASLWNSSGSNIYNTNSGNVGIGTTAPSGLLTINTSAQTTNLLNIIAHTSGTPTTEFLHATNASGSDVPTVGFDLENSAVNMFEIFGSSGGSSYTSRLSINLNNGNVGIGVGNPADKLTIAGTSYPTTFTGIGSTVGITGSIPTNGFAKLTFGNGAGGDYGGIGLLPTNSGSYLYFGTSNNYASGITNNAMVIDYNGNVGINTQSPGYQLTVAPSSSANGLWIASTGNENAALLTNMGAGGWNPMVQAGDNMLMWKGSSADNSNAGGLTIAPWSANDYGIRLTYNGNVGINQSNPITPLFVDQSNVEGANAAVISVGNSSTPFGATISGTGGGHALFGSNLYEDTNSTFRTLGTHTSGFGYAGMEAEWGQINFYTLGSTNTTAGAAVTPPLRMVITGNGGVGIGTASPDQLLTVSGIIHSTSGGFEFPDGTVLTSALPTTSCTNISGGNSGALASGGSYSVTSVSIATSSTKTLMSTFSDADWYYNGSNFAYYITYLCGASGGCVVNNYNYANIGYSTGSNNGGVHMSRIYPNMPADTYTMYFEVSAPYGGTIGWDIGSLCLSTMD